MKTIAILGASYLQVPLIMEAKSLGMRTIGFSWEDGAVAKSLFDVFYPYSVLDKEHILEVCRREKIDSILSIASDIVVPVISYVARELKLVSNSINSSLISTNKFLMREALSKNGINCPKFNKITSDYVPNNDELIKYPLIIKPVDRSGSLGVKIVHDYIDFLAASAEAINLSLSNEAIAEEFIKGFEVSVETISMNGKHYILAITDKVVSGPPNFVELEHHQPSVVNYDLSERIKSVVLDCLDCLDICFGGSHTELIITESNEIFVTEVGARMGGDFIGSHLVKLSTGYNFLRGVIEVSLGEFNIPLLDESNNSGIIFYDGKNKQILDLINNYSYEQNIICASLFNDKKTGKIKSSSDRLGYFIYQGNTRFIY